MVNGIAYIQEHVRQAAPVARPGALRVPSEVVPAPRDGRCCRRHDLQLEPRFPYSADWWPRCRACGRWHAPDGTRPQRAREPVDFHEAHPAAG